jgi:16S rRNA (cytosine1402-N4)-methyltransferase
MNVGAAIAASQRTTTGAPPMTRETDIGPVGAAHVPVMVGEVVEWLRPRPGARLVDATVGLGGHAAALVAGAPGSRLLGVDRDPRALARARERLLAAADRIILRHGDFARLRAILLDVGWGDGADAVLLDLGVSSLQLDDPSRGFSFRAEGPLDMRVDPGEGRDAAEIVNTWPAQDLARAIARYGEEPRARAVASAIVRARPLRTTEELARAVAKVLGPGKPRRGSGPPGYRTNATRTFQAIRIAVNEELDRLERFLNDGWMVLRPGGRLAVLAYHSLEDRLVKEAFRRWGASCLCPPGIVACVCGWKAKVRVLTRRPLRPTSTETTRNPRARSARLRLVERLRDA